MIWGNLNSVLHPLDPDTELQDICKNTGKDSEGASRALVAPARQTNWIYEHTIQKHRKGQRGCFAGISRVSETNARNTRATDSLQQTWCIAAILSLFCSSLRRCLFLHLLLLVRLDRHVRPHHERRRATKVLKAAVEHGCKGYCLILNVFCCCRLAEVGTIVWKSCMLCDSSTAHATLPVCMVMIGDQE